MTGCEYFQLFTAHTQFLQPCAELDSPRFEDVMDIAPAIERVSDKRRGAAALSTTSHNNDPFTASVAKPSPVAVPEK